MRKLADIVTRERGCEQIHGQFDGLLVCEGCDGAPGISAAKVFSSMIFCVIFFPSRILIVQ